MSAMLDDVMKVKGKQTLLGNEKSSGNQVTAETFWALKRSFEMTTKYNWLRQNTKNLKTCLQ